MVTEKTLERINELYHKSKAEGLTDAELAEQKPVSYTHLTLPTILLV